MNCSVCNQPIEIGAAILICYGYKFLGPTEYDLLLVVKDGSAYPIHESCLNNSVVATTIHSTGIPEGDNEHQMVSRSNALEFFREK